MPDDCLPTTPPLADAIPTPSEMIIAHAGAIAEIAMLLQDEPDRQQLGELVHGLVVVGRRVASNESRAARANAAT